jgi:AcrR family transcriptional regulator
MCYLMEPMSLETPTGRPREARIDRAIAAAALELMAEGSIADLKMDAVAERAGVGKAAIYRRFRSKDEMVASALGEMLASEIAIPDTGSTRGDLTELMREAVELYRKSPAGKLMPALIEAMRRDPELAKAIRERMLVDRRASLREVLDRGIERGDLAPDLDVELALDVLGGPLFYRLLITGGPLDERLVQGTVELILKGNAPTKERRT